METPILSKKQLKSSLSSKKKRPKETLKNVLVMPYNTLYWPVISDNESNYLVDILRDNLPRLKNKKVNVSWDVIKNVPKTERKAYRNELIKNNSTKVPLTTNNIGVHLGVNSVTKQLEKNTLGAILISESVEPRLIVKHIVDQAILYKVPILCISKLKSILKKHCGIASLVFAIERNVPADSNLNLIKTCIENTFEKCPPPKDHINYNRSLSENKIEKVADKEKFNQQVDENELRRDVYLTKPTNGSRAFVPVLQKSQNRMQVDESGFVPFITVSDDTTINESNTIKYKSLKVKRLKSDINRNKRKLSSINPKK